MEIILPVLILSGLALLGGIIMWRLWVSTRNMYTSRNAKVPIETVIATISTTACVIIPPLVMIGLLVTIF